MGYVAVVGNPVDGIIIEGPYISVDEIDELYEGLSWVAAPISRPSQASCVECGEKAHVFRDDVYGPNKGAWFCDICYASDYFPDNVIVAAARLGINGTIHFVPDDTECSNCGAVIDEMTSTHSSKFEKALHEERKNANDRYFQAG